MKIHIIVCCVLMLIVLRLPISAKSLDSAKTDSVQKVRENWYWAHIGAGVGLYAITDKNYSTGVPFALDLGLSVVYKSALLTLQWNSVGTIFSSSVQSYGGMYGWIGRDDGAFASVAVGLSYVEYRSLVPGTGGWFSGPPARYETSPGFGVIVEAQAAFKAYVPGLGFKVFGNLNTVRPFIAGMLIFHLGWMP